MREEISQQTFFFQDHLDLSLYMQVYTFFVYTYVFLNKFYTIIHLWYRIYYSPFELSKTNDPNEDKMQRTPEGIDANAGKPCLQEMLASTMGHQGWELT